MTLSAPDHELGPAFTRRNIPMEWGRLSCLHRPGTGSTLILIPGSFDDSSGCGDIIARLDDRMQLVVVELRGHGGSWPPPQDASIELFSEDVLTAASDLGLTSPLFVGGHSIGGMIAMQLARVRPEITRGVISIEGWTSHEVVEDAFAGRIFDTLSPALVLRKDEIRQRVFERWTPEQVAEFRTYWKKWDGSEFLAGTMVPVLELYGDRGRKRPGLDKLRIPDRKNIELVWVAGASHYLNIESPGEVARACTRFIERIERGGG